MKKLITICFFIATSFTVNAQQLTFEETVKYINDKIECCAEYKTTLIAQKDGTLKFKTYSINLFDLDDINTENCKYGICNRIGETSGNSYIYFKTGSTPNLAAFVSEKDAERVYNALFHLRSLCTKTKDPFDK